MKESNKYALKLIGRSVWQATKEVCFVLGVVFIILFTVIKIKAPEWNKTASEKALQLRKATYDEGVAAGIQGTLANIRVEGSNKPSVELSNVLWYVETNFQSKLATEAPKKK